MKTKKELLKLVIGAWPVEEQVKLLWAILNQASDEGVLDYFDITDLIGSTK